MANLNNRQALVESLKQAAERARLAREAVAAAAQVAGQAVPESPRTTSPAPVPSPGPERQP